MLSERITLSGHDVGEKVRTFMEPLFNAHVDGADSRVMLIGVHDKTGCVIGLNVKSVSTNLDPWLSGFFPPLPSGCLSVRLRPVDVQFSESLPAQAPSKSFKEEKDLTDYLIEVNGVAAVFFDDEKSIWHVAETEKAMCYFEDNTTFDLLQRSVVEIRLHNLANETVYFRTAEKSSGPKPVKAMLARSGPEICMDGLGIWLRAQIDPCDIRTVQMLCGDSTFTVSISCEQQLSKRAADLIHDLRPRPVKHCNLSSESSAAASTTAISNRYALSPILCIIEAPIDVNRATHMAGFVDALAATRESVGLIVIIPLEHTEDAIGTLKGVVDLMPSKCYVASVLTTAPPSIDEARVSLVAVKPSIPKCFFQLSSDRSELGLPGQNDAYLWLTGNSAPSWELLYSGQVPSRQQELRITQSIEKRLTEKPKGEIYYQQLCKLVAGCGAKTLLRSVAVRLATASCKPLVLYCVMQYDEPDLEAQWQNLFASEWNKIVLLFPVQYSSTSESLRAWLINNLPRPDRDVFIIDVQPRQLSSTPGSGSPIEPFVSIEDVDTICSTLSICCKSESVTTALEDIRKFVHSVEDGDDEGTLNRHIHILALAALREKFEPVQNLIARICNETKKSDYKNLAAKRVHCLAYLASFACSHNDAQVPSTFVGCFRDIPSLNGLLRWSPCNSAVSLSHPIIGRLLLRKMYDLNFEQATIPLQSLVEWHRATGTAIGPECGFFTTETLSVRAKKLIVNRRPGDAFSPVLANFAYYELTKDVSDSTINSVVEHVNSFLLCNEWKLGEGYARLQMSRIYRQLYFAARAWARQCRVQEKREFDNTFSSRVTNLYRARATDMRRDTKKEREQVKAEICKELRASFATKVELRWRSFQKLKDLMLSEARNADTRLESFDSKNNLAKSLAVFNCGNRGTLDNSPGAVEAVRLMEQLWEKGTPRSKRLIVYMALRFIPARDVAWAGARTKFEQRLRGMAGTEVLKELSITMESDGKQSMSASDFNAAVDAIESSRITYLEVQSSCTSWLDHGSLFWLGFNKSLGGETAQ